MRIIPTEGLAVQTLSDRKGAVALDIAVTPELEKEGIARDIIRLIQTTRKDVDLNISDRIALTLDVSDCVRDAVTIHKALIGEHTLADSIEFGNTDACAAKREHELNNETVHIGVSKI
jgi:isoleucyl-tRNA synthetase